MFEFSELIIFRPCLTRVLLISPNGTRSQIVAKATRSKYCKISKLSKILSFLRYTNNKKVSAVAHKSSSFDWSSGVLGLTTMAFSKKLSHS